MKIDGEEYSKDIGYEDKIRKTLIETLDKIDENFNMNASKRGTLALTKEEYKNDFIDAILSVDDIVYTNMDDENQYTLYFQENPTVSGAYVKTQVKNKLGTIPENIIIIANRSDIKPYMLMHETAHVHQQSRSSDIICSYSDITKMLNEGNANQRMEYIRDFNLKQIEDISASGYKLETIIYNKLSYLIGEKEMNEYIKKHDIDLISFLSDQLDEKYGKGTGLELYQHITNLSLWSTTYSGEVTQEKIDRILEEISTKNEYIEKERDKSNKLIQQILATNNNYKRMLDTIKTGGEYKNLDFDELTDITKKLELQGLEELTLKCVSKDIEDISSKKEALNYIQLWDYYRNRCLISKYYNGKEQTSKEWNFETVYEVQHKLYEKCVEYGALNTQDEQLFDCLLEAQLYDLSNAVIAYGDYEKQGDKLIISDQYLTNEFFMTEYSDGNKKYYLYEEYKGSSKVKGTKILAEREQEKER